MPKTKKIYYILSKRDRNKRWKFAFSIWRCVHLWEEFLSKRREYFLRLFTIRYFNRTNSQLKRYKSISDEIQLTQIIPNENFEETVSQTSYDLIIWSATMTIFENIYANGFVKKNWRSTSSVWPVGERQRKGVTLLDVLNIRIACDEKKTK